MIEIPTGAAPLKLRVSGDVACTLRRDLRCLSVKDRNKGGTAKKASSLHRRRSFIVTLRGQNRVSLCPLRVWIGADQEGGSPSRDRDVLCSYHTGEVLEKSSG